MKRILLTIVILTILSFAHAQAPSIFSFQALVRNASGEPVRNSDIGTKISILKGSIAGTVIYSESHVLHSNSNGLITADVGIGTVILGNMAEIDWLSGPYYIKSEFDPYGGTNYSLITTSQLLSVPYSLLAKTAEQSITSTQAENATYADSATYAVSAGNGLNSGTQKGDILYWDGTQWTKLSPGKIGQTLIMCHDKPTWGPCPELIQIQTDQAIDVGSNYATVHSTITTNGVLNSGSPRLYYSEDPEVDFTDASINCEYADNFTEFSGKIDFLKMGTTYYVQAVLSTDLGLVYSNMINFTTASESTLQTGQKYGGGYIFYLDESRQHGLIAMESVYLGVYGCQGVLLGSNAQGTAVGTGKSNTETILAGCNEELSAAGQCNATSFQGYTDWFLPSLEELRLIYINLIDEGIGSFSSYGNWTSTEFDANQGYYLDSSTGQKLKNKSLYLAYIPIRSF